MLNPDFSCIQKCFILGIVAYEYKRFALGVALYIFYCFELGVSVKAGERLVEKHGVGIADYRPCYRHPAAHAAGQLRHGFVYAVGKSDFGKVT